jgi:hypothetical protein
MPQDNCEDREQSILIAEEVNRLVLGVKVPLRGDFTEAEAEMARHLFDLALDIRVRMWTA